PEPHSGSLKATNNNFNDLAQAVAASQDMLRLRMTSRSYGGYKIFEGHNGMWRKKVLDGVGPWTDYYKDNIMITEDILKSAQMYANGYYGKSLNIETGEWVPSSLKALESMWMRWTYGTSQVLFKCFNKIYSKQVSLVEKFDISHHVLHHAAIGLFFPIALLMQLFVSGSATNVFLLAVYVLPQLIGAITSYFKSVAKLKMPFLKKIQHIYAGFFMMETFVMVTQLKSDINFMLGVPQGWKVTEKGVENAVSWKELIINKAFYFGIVLLSVGITLFSWKVNYAFEAPQWTHFIGLAFVNLNLLLSIFIFGKKVRSEENKVELATI
ncbi:MAG: glycosyltransferase family 2 protein, partial [Bacteroidota bacterium]